MIPPKRVKVRGYGKIEYEERREALAMAEDDEEKEEREGSLSWGRMVEVMRTLRQWKQSELAEAAGISNTSLSDYEREKLDPPDDARIRIEEALGVGDWPGGAQGELGWLLTVAEGGRVAPEVSRFLQHAAAGVTVSTETALRAGLEKLRRAREKALAQEAGPEETRPPSTE